MKSSLRIFFDILLVAGFLAVGAYTLLAIHGYKYDIKNQDFEKISIIDMGGKIDGAAVFIDGEKQSETFPFTVKGIVPGLHYIKIEKPSYIPYRANVFVFADFVTKIDSVVLMPEQVQFVSMKKDDVIDDSLFLSAGELGLNSKRDKMIYMENNEMWIKDVSGASKKFISRFGMPVTDAGFFSDDYNIMFVSGGMLNFCDQLMQNCYSLRKSKSGDRFASVGGKIYFKEKSSGDVSVLDLSGK